MRTGALRAAQRVCGSLFVCRAAPGHPCGRCELGEQAPSTHARAGCRTRCWRAGSWGRCRPTACQHSRATGCRGPGWRSRSPAAAGACGRGDRAAMSQTAQAVAGRRINFKPPHGVGAVGRPARPPASNWVRRVRTELDAAGGVARNALAAPPSSTATPNPPRRTTAQPQQPLVQPLPLRLTCGRRRTPRGGRPGGRCASWWTAERHAGVAPGVGEMGWEGCDASQLCLGRRPGGSYAWTCGSNRIPAGMPSMQSAWRNGIPTGIRARIVLAGPTDCHP